MGLTFSCQDEVIEETPATEGENIVPNSNLANLIRSTVTLDGSIDNIIDSANCIIVDLPITVVVNGITITIESVEDYDAIEDIMDQFANDDDEVQIQFPIIIILSDYTEVVVENQDELDSYIEDCFGENEADDDIECIDFQFPFTISIYDSTYQVIETVEINSDQELFSFINELQSGVLASINFPINMVLANGEVIQVNSNSELEMVIEAADDTCDEDDDNDYDDDDECDINLNEIEAFLYECPIEAYVYDADDEIIDINLLEFDVNNEVIVNGTPAVTEVGTWTLNEINSGYVLNIIGLNTFNLINGDWVLSGCESGHLTFTQDTGSEIRTMVFELDCDSNSGPLGCLEASDIILCDENNDGFEVFNLYAGLNDVNGCTINSPVTVSFHTSLVDAESNLNPILSATSFTNTMIPQTVYVRIEVFNNPSEYEILEIGLILEDCSNGSLGCLEANDIVLCDENNNGIEEFNLYAGLAEINGCTINNPVAVSFHTSLSDAESNVNTIAGATSFTNTSNPQTVYVRIEVINNPSQFEILEIGLYLEECSGETDQELENIMIEGQWFVANYNDSGVDETDDYNGYVLDFDSEGIVIATNGTETVSGSWDAFLDNAELKLMINFGTAIPLGEFSDNWDVVNFTNTNISLRDISGGSGETDILVFERI
jgi:hypothetical protein